MLDSKLVIIGDGIFWDPAEVLILPGDGYSTGDFLFLCDEKKSAEAVRAIPFSAYDGFAIKFILADILKIPSAVILQSPDFAGTIHRRCRDLKIPFCFTNVSDKRFPIAKLCHKYQYRLREITIFDNQLTPSDFPEEQPKFLLSQDSFKNMGQHPVRTFINTFADKNIAVLSFYDQTRMPQDSPNIRPTKRQIRALICDIDGTCTDGFKIYGEDNSEWKRFSLTDIRALKNWNDGNHLSFIITGESGPIPRKFATQCHIPEGHLFMDAGTGKVQILREICQNFALRPDEIAYIGDDMNDLGIMEYLQNGIAACPTNAMPLIKNIPHILQLKTTGGYGAVAEFMGIINGLGR